MCIGGARFLGHLTQCPKPPIMLTRMRRDRREHSSVQMMRIDFSGNLHQESFLLPRARPVVMLGSPAARSTAPRRQGTTQLTLR
jgi:hypothetical protein